MVRQRRRTHVGVFQLRWPHGVGDSEGRVFLRRPAVHPRYPPGMGLSAPDDDPRRNIPGRLEKRRRRRSFIPSVQGGELKTRDMHPTGMAKSLIEKLGDVENDTQTHESKLKRHTWIEIRERRINVILKKIKSSVL
mmetsp:Transcript_5563/g.13944  ORF Transcript_5563/g.13944 Transcript_5563/m.13944 type:complete len:136 (-) Transcript_5563:2469-2876(-)